MNAPAPIVRDAPPEAGWSSVVRTDDADALAAREALGLPTDRPVVMTGHHAAWWHPGLVAKFIAAQQIAGVHDAAWSWVLVDHKEADPWGVDVPAREGGAWTPGHARFAPPPPPDLASLRLPPVDPELRGVPDETLDAVRLGLGRITGALRAHAGAPGGLEQWRLAMGDLLKPELDLAGPIRATALLRTPAARRLVERMWEDPHACAIAYNRAGAGVPNAGVAPLHVGVDPGAVELPLWWVRDDGSLGRVFAGDMEGIAPERLAPRALLLTGLTRRLLCDLFIHGAGGYVYDSVTEAWFLGWLDAELAPMGAITADAALPLETPDVSAADVRRARQYAHRAAHQPALLGEMDAQREKFERVRAIRGMPRGSRERRAAYLAMHDMLSAHRARHSVELDAFRDEAERQQRLRASRAVAQRRTWAYALHDEGARGRLVERVERAVS